MDYAKEVNVPCEEITTLKEAMPSIKKEAVNGDIVLLSPASASWDQYIKFEDRGNEFKNIVNNY